MLVGGFPRGCARRMRSARPQPRVPRSMKAWPKVRAVATTHDPARLCVSRCEHVRASILQAEVAHEEGQDETESVFRLGQFRYM